MNNKTSNKPKYFIVSFNTLKHFSPTLEETESLFFRPTSYVFKRVFTSKNEAEIYKAEVELIILNLDFLDQLYYTHIIQSDNKKKIHSNKLDSFYESLMTYECYGDVFTEFTSLWSELRFIKYLPVDVIKLIQKEIPQEDQILAYKKLASSEEESMFLLKERIEFIKKERLDNILGDKFIEI